MAQIHTLTTFIRSRDSSVSTVTMLWAGRQGFNSRQM